MLFARNQCILTLGDRLRIGHVVFLTLDERLYVSRRDQPDFVAKIAYCPAPVMGACASFHGHHARLVMTQECQQLRTR